MIAKKNDILQGTLALLILKTLAQGKRMHGYAITAHIQRVSDHLLRVEEGSWASHATAGRPFQSPDAREYGARKSVIQCGSGRRVRCAGQRLLRGGTHIDTVTDTVRTFLCRSRGATIGAG